MPFIKEYLVKLGVLDSFTDKLEGILKNGSEKIGNFAAKWGKSFAVAGGAVTSAVAVAGVGVAKFLTKLVDADDALTQFARSTWQSRDNAWKTKTALDAMGKSLEEIRMNPQLFREFIELRQNAEKLRPPDMSEGLNQVRGVITEFNRLKQLGGAAIQWVGFYLLKYIERPIQQVKDALGGVNDKLTKTLPVWSEKIAQALSWIVRLGGTLIRGAGLVLKAIKRVFDSIPDHVKTATAAFAGLMAFIRTGPVGKLIAILSLGLLLLDDFFTYLDGGDALLDGLWGSLLKVWNLFRDSGAIEKCQELLGNLLALAKELGDPFISLGRKILAAFTGGGKNALEWFIIDGFPKLISFVSGAVEKSASLIQKLNDLGLTEPIIIGIVSAFAGLKIIDGITESVNKLNAFIKGISEAEKAVGHIKALKNAFGALKETIGLTKVAQEAHNLIMMVSAARSGGLAAAQGALATAEGSATAAQWALNAAMNANVIGVVILAIVALISVGALLVKNWDKVKEFFLSLWSGIKETFSGIGAWFSEKFTQAKEAVTNAFSNIGEWFKEKALAIIAALILIPQKIREKISEGIEFIKNLFATLPDTVIEAGKNIVTSLWTGIMKMRTWLKEKVTGFFKNIWNGVKGVFTGGGGDPDPKTGVEGGHAEGGIFTREHTARFAEGNRPEAVVPLTKPKRAREVLDGIAKFYGTAAPDTETPQIVAGMQAFLERANTMLVQMGTAMKAGAAAAAMNNISTNTVQNNQKYDMKSTFNIYGSGDPQSTAQAVDRQNQLRIRNMQGVIV